jgi:ABC-type uncharacterized transport system substrate-binding protein
VLPGADDILEEINDAASKLRVTIRSVEVRGPDDLPATFARMTSERIGGIVFVTSADLHGHLRRIAELAIEHRIPMMSLYRDATVAGSLLSYGPDLSHIFRRSATYVDKILKGAKPGDLASNRAAHQVRAGHQHEDGEGPRPDDPAVAPPAGG